MVNPLSRNKPDREHLCCRLMEVMGESSGCAVCICVGTAIGRYFDMLFHEMVNDIPTRRELSACGGYCREHIRLLSEYGNPLGTAIIYRDQVENFRDLIATADKAYRIKPPSEPDCPACRRRREAEKMYIAALVDGLRTDKMKDAFAAGAGLCLPHFLAAVERAGNEQTRKIIVEVQAGVLAAIAGDLDEFIRKNDYRFRHEGFGPEADSWKRAVRIMTGHTE